MIIFYWTQNNHWSLNQIQPLQICHFCLVGKLKMELWPFSCSIQRSVLRNKYIKNTKWLTYLNWLCGNILRPHKKALVKAGTLFAWIFLIITLVQASASKSRIAFPWNGPWYSSANVWLRLLAKIFGWILTKY